MTENNDVAENEKRVADSIGITVDQLKEWESEILQSYMYPILVKMLENNLFDLEKTKDKQYLWCVVKENV